MAPFVVECDAPAVRFARERLTTDLPHVVSRIMELCLDASDKAVGDHSAEARATRQRRMASFRSLAFALDWASHDGRWTAYRILLCTTWSLHSVSDTPPDTPCDVSSALGAVFDDTCCPHHVLRPLANLWAGWATRSVERMMAAWRSAVPPSLPPTQDAAPPVTPADDVDTVYESDEDDGVFPEDDAAPPATQVGKAPTVADDLLLAMGPALTGHAATQPPPTLADAIDLSPLTAIDYDRAAVDEFIEVDTPAVNASAESEEEEEDESNYPAAPFELPSPLPFTPSVSSWEGYVSGVGEDGSFTSTNSTTKSTTAHQ